MSDYLPLYAEAGIFDYWIFNLLETCLECYSEPYQNSQGKFGYRVKRIFLPNETVSLPNFGDLSLDFESISSWFSRRIEFATTQTKSACAD